ncbi:MAG: gamma-butyrobetaine hydroxylase-like domain-containing protein [Chloroflexota bacterium]
MINPIAIEADRAADRLSIGWEDGHESVYSLAALRWACPCAGCRGEWGQPGMLDAVESLPGEELRLVSMSTVGMYAIAPVWASGHSSGIYSFDYLRSICPCTECGSKSPSTSRSS